jgi:hypothetical protein
VIRIPNFRFCGAEPCPSFGGHTLPLACAILLGLAMFHPSAHAQTLTVLHSFREAPTADLRLRA